MVAIVEVAGEMILRLVQQLELRYALAHLVQLGLELEAELLRKMLGLLCLLVHWTLDRLVRRREQCRQLGRPEVAYEEGFGFDAIDEKLWTQQLLLLGAEASGERARDSNN